MTQLSEYGIRGNVAFRGSKHDLELELPMMQVVQVKEC